MLEHTPPDQSAAFEPSSAVVVHLRLGRDGEDATAALAEFESLAVSAGARVVARIQGHRDKPEPRYFVGSGKAQAIRDAAYAAGSRLVLINHDLSPSQERNLEQLLACRVLGRTGLILDIFAQRARTYEGKLQVELAQLSHLSTRLVRGWTHLERQKGGIGLRGPGETQLETDRRLLAERIRQIHSRLARVRNRREQGRGSRRRAQLPTLALVGYTNAGKSTVFNAMTGADAYAADQLFATLDPTLRRVDLGANTPVVLADTVGFIQRLPHELVAAFHATLRETAEADLLLHVVDCADPERRRRIEAVHEVLARIGASAVPRLMVYNKIDRVGRSPGVDRDAQGLARRVWVSAATGEGLEALSQALLQRCRSAWVRAAVSLPPAAGRARAKLFELGVVEAESVDAGGGSHLRVWIAAQRLERWRQSETIPAHCIQCLDARA